MKKINDISSTMLPLNMSNVDTDQIMPKQFLKRVERSGYGEFLFFDWKKDPDFSLNKKEYQGSKVLVAGDNFGTGSSREHAPWGLQDWGFDAIISTKFADIFKLNSINIGLLPIESSLQNVEGLFEKLRKIHAQIYRYQLITNLLNVRKLNLCLIWMTSRKKEFWKD